MIELKLKCDGCHKPMLATERWRVLVQQSGGAQNEMDLCDQCGTELQRFLKPRPKP